MTRRQIDSLIVTYRLDLIAGTAALVHAELHDRDRFGALLDATVPTQWPPPLNDRATMEWCLRFLKKHSDGIGWANWYFVLRLDGQRRRVVIGEGGFRGKPTRDGTVEVGYSILKAFQDQGYATEATSALVRWAFAHSETARVIAETYPEHATSIRVVEKNGFVFSGSGSLPGVIRYIRTRKPSDT